MNEKIQDLQKVTSKEFLREKIFELQKQIDSQEPVIDLLQKYVKDKNSYKYIQDNIIDGIYKQSYKQFQCLHTDQIQEQITQSKIKIQELKEKAKKIQNTVKISTGVDNQSQIWNEYTDQSFFQSQLDKLQPKNKQDILMTEQIKNQIENTMQKMKTIYKKLITKNTAVEKLNIYASQFNKLDQELKALIKSNLQIQNENNFLMQRLEEYKNKHNEKVCENKNTFNIDINKAKENQNQNTKLIQKIKSQKQLDSIKSEDAQQMQKIELNIKKLKLQIEQKQQALKVKTEENQDLKNCLKIYNEQIDNQNQVFQDVIYNNEMILKDAELSNDQYFQYFEKIEEDKKSIVNQFAKTRAKNVYLEEVIEQKKQILKQYQQKLSAQICLNKIQKNKQYKNEGNSQNDLIQQKINILSKQIDDYKDLLYKNEILTNKIEQEINSNIDSFCKTRQEININSVNSNIDLSLLSFCSLEELQ